MIIVLNFICGPCGEGHHRECVSMYGLMEVIKSQCDCQHRERPKPDATEK